MSRSSQPRGTRVWNLDAWHPRQASCQARREWRGAMSMRRRGRGRGLGSCDVEGGCVDGERGTWYRGTTHRTLCCTLLAHSLPGGRRVVIVIDVLGRRTDTGVWSETAMTHLTCVWCRMGKTCTAGRASPFLGGFGSPAQPSLPNRTCIQAVRSLEGSAFRTHAFL